MQSLPDHIYRTKNPDTGEHTGYRVMFQVDKKVTTKSFNFKKYENALEAAINYRNANLISVKRSNCSTGMIGVTKTSSVISNKRYYTYSVTWRSVDKKQKTRSFVYASMCLKTLELKYDADCEFRAYIVACHLRQLAELFKLNGKISEFDDYINKLNLLKSWKRYSPAQIFGE